MAWSDILAMVYLLGVVPLGFLLGALLGGPSRRGRGAWAIVGLLFPPAIILLVARRLRHEPGVPAATGPRHVEAVQDPGDLPLADLPVPIRACPNCGFLGIRMPTIGDGLWPGGGELVEQVCPRCHYKGPPIEFREAAEYRRFVQELAQQA